MAKKDKTIENQPGAADTKKAAFLIIGMLLLVVLYLWHMSDVYAGAAGSGDSFLIRDYIILGVFLICSCGLLLLLFIKKRAGLAAAYAAAMLLLGTAGIFVFRGLSAPDEVSHYISAYRLSNVLMLKEAEDEYGRVYVREQDMYLEDTEGRLDEIRAALDAGEENVDTTLNIFGQRLDEEVYRVYEQGTGNKNAVAEKTALSCQWTVNTVPAAYLPQAIGITAARLAGLGPLGLITLGKLFNLLFFTAVTAFSVSLIKKGGELLCAVGLLPMTVHLASSMSYDAYVIGMSFLFIALVLHIRESSGAKTAFFALPVVLALLGPCKIVYSLLIFLLLLVPAKNRRSFFWAAVMCILLLGISMYLVNSVTLSDYAEAEERIITWAEEPEGYTLSYLIHRPAETVRIFYDTFMTRTGNWFSTMFGLYLGNQDPVLNVPYPVIGIMAAGLAVIAAGCDIRLNGREKLVCCTVFLMVLGALMGSMLLAYTPRSSHYIEGVQGRYLLPVLPLPLAAVSGDWLVPVRKYHREVLASFILLDAFVLLRVYSTVCMRL